MSTHHPRRADVSAPMDLIRQRGLHSRQMPERSPDCVWCGRATRPFPSPFGGWFLPPLCEGCQAKADREDRREEGAQRAAEAKDSALRAAGLTCGDISSTGSVGPKAMESALGGLERTPSNSWAYIHSPEPGCGKTTQLQLAVRHYLAQGWSCRYVPQPLMISELRAAEDERLRLDLIRRYVALDLLALDEFGRGAGNEWNAELLLEVLDRRYSERRATLLASNWALAEISRARELGTRVSSRIEERAAGRVLCLRWNWRSGRLVPQEVA